MDEDTVRKDCELDEWDNEDVKASYFSLAQFAGSNQIVTCFLKDWEPIYFGTVTGYYTILLPWLQFILIFTTAKSAVSATEIIRTYQGDCNLAKTQAIQPYTSGSLVQDT
ncbi:hypothetical protein BDR04DRAFT_1175902 [Suillus decipiens]|nr:hypothetical protein BDR04DRAFT_1175902 [Suillus decipiens]